jgi:hypothetical protein
MIAVILKVSQSQAVASAQCLMLLESRLSRAVRRVDVACKYRDSILQLAIPVFENHRSSEIDWKTSVTHLVGRCCFDANHTVPRSCDDIWRAELTLFRLQKGQAFTMTRLPPSTGVTTPVARGSEETKGEKGAMAEINWETTVTHHVVVGRCRVDTNSTVPGSGDNI